METTSDEAYPYMRESTQTRNGPSSRTKVMSIRFGNSKAFLELLIALAIIGFAISLATRSWDYWLAIGFLAVLVIASPLALFKAW